MQARKTISIAKALVLEEEIYADLMARKQRSRERNTVQSACTQEIGIVEKWITTTEAAEIMGVTVRAVQQLCAQGQIVCRQWGKRAWMVSEEAAKSYQKPASGRPMKIDDETD